MKGGILQEVDCQASACGHCQIFPTSLSYSLPLSLADRSGPELLGWGWSTVSRKSQIFEGRPRASKLFHPTGRLLGTIHPANSCPRSGVMTQGASGEALRKAALTFFPIVAPSAPLLLPGTPLNSPPPSLLPSSLPTMVLPFSSPRVSSPPPHPTPIQHLPCSLGVRPVNHRRRQPQPGPHLLPGFWRASGSCLGPPSAQRRAGRSVSGARRGEPPGPPGLGLPVTDSVSMANNLTPTIVWRGQAPGQITRPIRARAAAPHARLE